MNGQQLKNSILQMAVQGKLVPQDPNDEPASVLIQRIRAEKEKLIKEKKLKKEKNPSYIFRGSDNLHYEKIGDGNPVCIEAQLPFEIPNTWEWARISSIGYMVRGKGIKRTEIVDHGFPCIRYGEIYTSYNISFTDALSHVEESIYKSCNHISNGDIVMTLTGENKPDIAKAIVYLGDGNIAAGGDLAYWTRHGMSPLYLVFFMASPYCIEQKRRTATGDIIVHISTEKIGSFFIPIPPLAEQQRIVAKIEQILPHIREYELSESRIGQLNAAFPEQLKKSILQEAVQGKLVPQDPSDEPASALLERIREEKARLVKEGKIKKDKNESMIFRRDNSYYEKSNGVERCIDEELPFEIPDSWCWARLKQLGITQTGNTPSKNHKEYFGDYIPFIGPGNISEHGIISSDKGLTRQGLEFGRLVKAGSILQVCIGGSIGKAAINQVDVTFNQQINSITPIACCKEYLFYVMTAPYFIKIIKERAGGTATPIINRGEWDNILIPLAPLKEQNKIVVTVKSAINFLRF